MSQLQGKPYEPEPVYSYTPSQLAALMHCQLFTPDDEAAVLEAAGAAIWDGMLRGAL